MIAAGTSLTDEAHTVAHEVGHTGSHPEHSGSGLLMPGAPKIVNGVPNDHFDNDAQATFRELETW